MASVSKYIVMNISEGDIQLRIPAPPGSGRDDAYVIVKRSNALDIMPLAGSLEDCRRIRQIYDLKCRNCVVVVEE